MAQPEEKGKAIPCVVGRLAPSPTGYLHVGHAFSFLIAWWSARSKGGRVILRIDDVDIGRADQKFQKAAQDDLQWLGIDWDGPVSTSSENEERIQEAAFALLESGRAYPCVCSRKVISEVVGAPQQGTSEVRYPGTCLGRYSDLAHAERESGTLAGLRYKTETGQVRFLDQLFGSRCGDVEAQVGDFLLLRRDKSPAYQLAVVVLDALDRVTEVVRGRDLLESTLRQILLQRSLQLETPSYLHVPLICDERGRRLAKRHDALSIASLREAGIRPEAIVAWVAQNAGQAQVPASICAREMVERFVPEHLCTHDVLLTHQFGADLKRRSESC